MSLQLLIVFPHEIRPASLVEEDDMLDFLRAGIDIEVYQVRDGLGHRMPWRVERKWVEDRD